MPCVAEACSGMLGHNPSRFRPAISPITSPNPRYAPRLEKCCFICLSYSRKTQNLLRARQLHPSYSQAQRPVICRATAPFLLALRCQRRSSTSMENQARYSVAWEACPVADWASAVLAGSHGGPATLEAAEEKYCPAKHIAWH